MLIDPIWARPEGSEAKKHMDDHLIAAGFEPLPPPQRIRRGLYYTTGNMHIDFDRTFKIMEGFHARYDLDFPELVNKTGAWASAYGVADNPEQVLAFLPMLELDERKFVVGFESIDDSYQPHSDGGWYWHKNGEYIGTRDQYEPLGEGNSAVIYHIYEMVEGHYNTEITP